MLPITEPILPNADWQDQGKSSLEAIDKLLDDSVSGILIEGSSGSAGYILYPLRYLQEIEKMCRDRNIILICDEVMSGFGRTGSFGNSIKNRMSSLILLPVPKLLLVVIHN